MNEMPVPVIQIHRLSKRFKHVLAVDNLNLEVHRGDIFGFLGPNGSGKSTTIRMLASLIRPDHGYIQLFGLPLKGNRLAVLSRIGAIIEKPDFYLFLSAYKNLEILYRMSKQTPNRQKIVETLGLVGLSERMDSKVRTFSHGMKQRLGIAQALLHDPELLILDEPDNGLDPQGIKDIRELIRFLNKDKKITIFLSSHKLYEIEQIANRMAIIDKGRTVLEGNVKELLTGSIMKVIIDTDDPDLAYTLLAQTTLPIQNIRKEEGHLMLDSTQPAIPDITKYLIDNGIRIYRVCPDQSLEDFFIRKMWNTRVDPD